MRNLTERVTIELVTEDCCSCGVIFAMPAALNRKLRENGEFFYCPSGHKQHYTETEASRERKLREQAERRLEAEKGWSARLEETLEREKKSHASTKGQLTKARKKVQAGVCPVDGCRRHFENLERHMKNKHPEVEA